MTIRNLRVLGFVMMMAFAAVGLSASAHAEAKIAVVDLQRIIAESKAGQGIQKQLDTLREQFQTEVAKQETDLRVTEEELANAKDQAGSEAYIQKKADFEKRLLSARQSFQKRKQDLEKAAVDSVNQLRLEAINVIGALAEKEKYDVVMTKQNVIMVSKNLEITDRVLKELNGKVSKIDVKVQSAKQ